jgi:hypothetical protein
MPGIIFGKKPKVTEKKELDVDLLGAKDRAELSYDPCIAWSILQLDQAFLEPHVVTKVETEPATTASADAQTDVHASTPSKTGSSVHSKKKSNTNNTNKKGRQRFVCVSDTHGLHRGLAIPPGDVLVHCGDFSSTGGAGQVSFQIEIQRVCRLLLPFKFVRLIL